MDWSPMDTAPKGGGAEYVTDPAWVEPPVILLKFAGGEIITGKWDWYYSEIGNGFQQGVSAWTAPCCGAQLALIYDEPIAWAYI